MTVVRDARFETRKEIPIRREHPAAPAAPIFGCQSAFQRLLPRALRHGRLLRNPLEPEDDLRAHLEHLA